MAPSAPDTTTADRIILPTQVHPTHYDITLTPDLSAFTFTGYEEIQLVVNQETREILLNTDEIEIQKAKLIRNVGKTEETWDITNISYDKSKQQATLALPDTLHPGADPKPKLQIHFTGILNDKMCGFYRSSYEDAKSGEKRWMAVTQFEAADARKAFPCWDEPSIKATFDITLRVPSNLTALSNMDVREERKEGELKVVRFNTTPIMSTYLVAFTVGELEFIEASTTGEHNEGKPVLCRIYTPPGLSSQGAYALSVTTRVLEYYAKIFGTPYPLPKMDMLAVPDFEAGAMENWGLVTYRTVLLLWEEGKASGGAQQRIASVVAHELAHQWFGNLVTMEWWSHLWLNEGFATWVGELACDYIHPEWDVWTRFVVDDVQRGLHLDSLRSSHPIEVEVRDVAEIGQIFDAISYSKGGSVIRMLSNFLGRDTFLAGIRRYLQKHRFANASTGDLWAALSEESGEDVSKFMTLWTRQIGYPVLSVKEVEGGEKFHVEQHRFLSSGDVNSLEDEHLWWVPLNLMTEKGPVPNSPVLSDRSGTYDVPKGAAFYKLNAQVNGVYRVHYPVEHVKRLGQAVEEGKGALSASDRISLLADAGSLASAGVSKTSALLELLGHYHNERDFIVWAEVASQLGQLRSLWHGKDEEIEASLKRLQANLFGPVVERLGWEVPKSEDILTCQLRSLAISRAGQAGVESVVKEAKRRFKIFVENKDESIIHPDLRGAVFRTVITNREDGEEAEKSNWETILHLYRETKTTDQKLTALSCLGATKNPELINRALDLSLSREDVRPNDIIYLYRGLGDNPSARVPFWAFVQKNWPTFKERYEGSLALLGSVVKASLGGFADAAVAKEAEDFFSADPTGKRYIARPLQQTLESIDLKAKWLERSKSDVSDWAKGQNHQ